VGRSTKRPELFYCERHTMLGLKAFCLNMAIQRWLHFVRKEGITHVFVKKKRQANHKPDKKVYPQKKPRERNVQHVVNRKGELGEYKIDI